MNRLIDWITEGLHEVFCGCGAFNGLDDDKEGSE